MQVEVEYGEGRMTKPIDKKTNGEYERRGAWSSAASPVQRRGESVGEVEVPGDGTRPLGSQARRVLVSGVGEWPLDPHFFL